MEEIVNCGRILIKNNYHFYNNLQLIISIVNKSLFKESAKAVLRRLVGLVAEQNIQGETGYQGTR